MSEEQAAVIIAQYEAMLRELLKEGKVTEAMAIGCAVIEVLAGFGLLGRILETAVRHGLERLYISGLAAMEQKR